MKRTKQLLGAVSATALIAMTSAPALAAGTSAGESITNTVTVDYQVGGINQNDVSDSDTFVVDRKIDVDVTYIGTGTNNTGPVSVTPGETDAVLVFDVQNLSNAEIDLSLEALLNGGTGADADIDDENFTYYIDVNNDGALDAGDTQITGSLILDDVAEDQIVRVLVVTDIGLDATNAETFDVVLTADAVEDNGSQITNASTTTINGNTVNTVLADGQGVTDGDNDGADSAEGQYLVAAAAVTVAKSSQVLSDGISSSNPRAIPGAVVEYCIVVANGTGAATATDVEVRDPLPADVSFAGPAINIAADGTCAGGSDATSATVAGGDATFNSGTSTVEVDFASFPANTTRSIYFTVTID